MECKEEIHNLIEQFKLLKSIQNLSTTSLTDSVDVNHLLHKVIGYQLHGDNVLDKHLKYLKPPVLGKELFWGLGIENESYLMLDTYGDAEKFRKLKLKRERYSVDYYNNFDLDKLQDVFIKLYDCDNLRYPIYINAHTFQRTDVNWEHQTYYDEKATPNPKFKETLHNLLMLHSKLYAQEYDKSFVFDGDTIEFITQHFRNTTVNDCVGELITMKNNFIKEVKPYFKKWKIGNVKFPDHNYGLVSFLTTYKRNITTCNNGTLHINLTLPTYLENGEIVDKVKFTKDHMKFIDLIQILEPLIIATYGTPDLFSVINPEYSMGSLRLSLSRYVSLQTYNTKTVTNGKQLLQTKPEDPNFWYNQLHKISPYVFNNNIGFDINFNKFKNHGVEIRFLDWFPEEYLKDLINVFVLLAQHSLELENTSFKKENYNNIVLNCVQSGFTSLLSIQDCNQLLTDLHLDPVDKQMSAYELLKEISDRLYEKYNDGSFVKLISPNMEKPHLVNYNSIAFKQLYKDVYNKPDLIIRNELNPLEYRTPIAPVHLLELKPYFNIFVESSNKRCYTDEEYVLNGAVIVNDGYWKNSKNSFIIGLKEIDSKTNYNQTLMHFAHCFKKQSGYKEILNNLEDSIFVDYEFILDSNNKRVISFGKQSGKIGCYLGLMAYNNQQIILEKHKKDVPNSCLALFSECCINIDCTGTNTFINNIPLFDEESYKNILDKSNYKPKVLIIGNGTVSRSSQDILIDNHIDYTVWTRENTKEINTLELLNHDILINAISLKNKPATPFLILDDLDKNRNLSVIVDISCDLGNPDNTLPIYMAYNTKDKLVTRINNKPILDLIAVNNLPSLEPVKSSFEFSSILKEYLPELLYFRYTKNIDTKANELYKSYQKCKEVISELNHS